MVLIYLISLALVVRKLLMLAIKYVSEKNVSRLSLSRVLLLLFRKLVPLGIT